LKRAAKTRASELASVTKALSYPRAQSSGGASGSDGPLRLEGVREQDGDEMNLIECNSMVEGKCPLQVGTFYSLVEISVRLDHLKSDCMSFTT
jgi:hypothetical protein